MRSFEFSLLLAATVTVAACGSSAGESAVPGAAETAGAEDTLFATVPESAWIDVDGPTLVAFHPVVSNDSLEADESLAMALDDLSYHIGSAMDSLAEAGYSVTYSGGDTAWLRTRSARSRFVREADSATVGYVFADTLGRRVTIYGLRSSRELIAFAHEFRRTGTLRRDR